LAWTRTNDENRSIAFFRGKPARETFSRIKTNQARSTPGTFVPSRFGVSPRMLLIILIILIFGFGFGGYRLGPGLGYYGGGGLSLILTIVLILLLLKVV
jgi:hypothetical protein